MEFRVIDDASRVDTIFEDQRVDEQNNKYYYFASQTIPGYRPIVYGVTSRPLSSIVLDYFRRLFSLS